MIQALTRPYRVRAVVSGNDLAASDSESAPSHAAVACNARLNPSSAALVHDGPSIGAKQVALRRSARLELDRGPNVYLWTLLVCIDRRPKRRSHFEELPCDSDLVLWRAQQPRESAVLNDAVAYHGAVASKKTAIGEQGVRALTTHQRSVDEQQPIRIHRPSLYAKERGGWGRVLPGSERLRREVSPGIESGSSGRLHMDCESQAPP